MSLDVMAHTGLFNLRHCHYGRLELYADHICSGVRHATDISMEGGTYTRSFFVADVYFSGDLEAQGAVNVCLAQSDFAVIMALPHKENRARIVGFVPDDGKELHDVTFDDCRPSVSRCMPRITVDEVRW